MAIALKTHKMLWGRAANRCAICHCELVEDETLTDDASVIGEACHIVAQSVDGPRGHSPLSAEQRDKYANLVLLCNVHHKIIDDQPVAYSVERLNEIKSIHEKWVRESLGLDVVRQREDEIYSSYVDEWATRMQLDRWNTWASWFLSAGQPSVSDEMKLALDDVRPWILARVWPLRYPALEAAFHNFRHVAQDLMLTFGKHAEQPYGEIWRTRKFYKIEDWDPERYRRLSDAYEEHVELVEDLLLELTRAANYLCDHVRSLISPSYRMNEGVLLVTAGPFMDLTNATYRVEYRGDERIDYPYPGLYEFMTARFGRDRCFGSQEEE